MKYTFVEERMSRKTGAQRVEDGRGEMFCNILMEEKERTLKREIGVKWGIEHME